MRILLCVFYTRVTSFSGLSARLRVKHLSHGSCLDVVQAVCNPIDGSTTEASSSIVDPVGRQVAESEVCRLLSTASKAIYDNKVDGLAGECKPQCDCLKVGSSPGQPKSRDPAPLAVYFQWTNTSPRKNSPRRRRCR